MCVCVCVCVCVYIYIGVYMYVYTPLCVIAAQKIKFSIKNFFSKCGQISRKLRTWSLVIYTKEMLNGKLHFLCIVLKMNFMVYGQFWNTGLFTIN